MYNDSFKLFLKSHFKLLCIFPYPLNAYEQITSNHLIIRIIKGKYISQIISIKVFFIKLQEITV